MSYLLFYQISMGKYLKYFSKFFRSSQQFSRNSINYQNRYYLLTHTRAGPWVIGVILGYFIFKIKQNEISFKLNRIIVFVFWGVCLGTLLACVLGGHSTLRGKEYDKWGNAVHIALVRTVWSIAISWIILACATSYGGTRKKIENRLNSRF